MDGNASRGGLIGIGRHFMVTSLLISERFSVVSVMCK